jgi:hypothetical protein
MAKVLLSNRQELEHLYLVAKRGPCEYFLQNPIEHLPPRERMREEQRRRFIQCNGPNGGRCIVELVTQGLLREMGSLESCCVNKRPWSNSIRPIDVITIPQ